MSENQINQTDVKESAKQTKVLLVDDQMIVFAGLKKVLADRPDIVINYCSDPTKAIATANEFLPDVILQDLEMPEIHGLQLLKFYRSHPQLKEIPVIVLTSNDDPETKKKLFDADANDYLVKMPHEKELKARIDMQVRTFRLKQEKDKLFMQLRSELDKAAEYVISLLPIQITNEPILTDWRFIPSAELGGDIFGYHWIYKDNFAMYLLDVCGHGVGSALLAVTAYNALKAQTLPSTDFTKPDQVLSALNEAFQMAEHNDLYFTMWYGCFNVPTRKLSFGSAGHPPAILFLDGKTESYLNCENFIIGGVPGFPFSSLEIDVPKDSLLYVYSDGVYEIEKLDGSMWTIEEMVDYIKQNEIDIKIDDLYKFVQKLSNKKVLDDDFSMLKILFK